MSNALIKELVSDAIDEYRNYLRDENFTWDDNLKPNLMVPLGPDHVLGLLEFIIIEDGVYVFRTVNDSTETSSVWQLGSFDQLCDVAHEFHMKLIGDEA